MLLNAFLLLAVMFGPALSGPFPADAQQRAVMAAHQIEYEIFSWTLAASLGLALFALIMHTRSYFRKRGEPGLFSFDDG
jgi:hypothetical protein